MTEVHLRADHRRIATQHLAEVRRHRVEVPHLRVGDCAPATPDASAGLADRTEGTAPAKHQQFRVAGRVIDFEIGHHDAVDLRLPQPDHLVVVGTQIGDVAGAVGLFQSADSVFEPGRPRDRELPCQRLRIACIGRELGTGLRETDIDTVESAQIRDAPRLRTVGDRAVGQQDHRGAVRQRDTRGFDCGLETVRGRAGR